MLRRPLLSVLVGILAAFHGIPNLVLLSLNSKITPSEGRGQEEPGDNKKKQKRKSKWMKSKKNQVDLPVSKAPPLLPNMLEAEAVYLCFGAPSCALTR